MISCVYTRWCLIYLCSWYSLPLLTWPDGICSVCMSTRRELAVTYTHKYCTCFCTHHNLLPYGGCNSMDVGQKTCVRVCRKSGKVCVCTILFRLEKLGSSSSSVQHKKFGQTIHMQCSALHSTCREYKVVGVNIVLHTGRYLLLSYWCTHTQ